MDAALPWGGHEEPAELPKLAANDRGARGRVDPGGLDQGGGWIGALSTSNAIIALKFQTSSGRAARVCPAESHTRTASSYSPSGRSRVVWQNVRLRGAVGSRSSSACCQVRPASVETSTRMTVWDVAAA